MNHATPRKVFVVDDDEAVRDSMKAILESSGLDVADFASAQAFLDAKCKDQSGCLLLDFHMPGMTGLELLEHLRAHGSRLPVIVVTGRGDAMLKERVLRAGAAEMLDKPIDENILMHALDRAFAAGANAQA